MGRYLGRESTYGVFEKQNIVPDGITKEFNLDHQIGSATSILVINTVNGVTKILEAGLDYNIVNGGQKIVFADAPTADDRADPAERLFILYLGKQLLVPIGDGQITANKLNLSYNELYAPNISTFSPMTIDATTISEASYQVLGKIVRLRLKIVIELNGASDNKIRVSLPVNNDGNTNISSTVVISSSDSLENGIVRWGAINAIDIYRQSGINYVAPKTYTIEATIEYNKA